MLFNSLEFLFVFFPLFLALYFLIRNRTWKNLIILIFSLFFYTWGEPKNILLMLLMIALSYFAALLISVNKGKKIVLLLYLVSALSLLGYFKYFNFLISIVNGLTPFSINARNIVLPIGISFYTFQCMSYVFDVYRKNCEVQRNILHFACYVALFPQLIAGPIVRYTTIEEELTSRSESKAEFLYGVERFVYGLAKKVILANNLALIADTIFNSNIHTIPVNAAWLGAISYALQIYYDFSGYSDMAIGIGRMLGFHFLENFDYPYLSRSITEFWRRWHISLGTWFRDYVYIPLGGNRVSLQRWILNIFIVWGLTGLWHGASWNFVLWGLYFAVILILEKKFLHALLIQHPRLAHLYALFLILIGWVIFRTETLADCFYYFAAMIDIRHLGSIASLVRYGIIENLLFLILGFIFAIPHKKGKTLQKLVSFPWLHDIVLTALFLISVMLIVNESYSPFIYFRF